MASDNFEHARENARGWLESIQEMTARLEHAQTCTNGDDCELALCECGEIESYDIHARDDGHDFTEQAGLFGEYPRAEYHDADKAREAIEESALSVELSGTWAPGATPEADSYIILLTTGGPALRIVGSLGVLNAPCSATLEMQDWGTPWESFSRYSAILTFARCFYFRD